MEFTEVLEQYHIPYHQGDRFSRPGWVNLKCPFCGKDPYLGYNIGGRYCSCWNCGSHNPVSILCALTSMGWKEACAAVEEMPCHKSRLDRTACGILKEPEGVRHFHDSHFEYLVHRGFHPTRIFDRWKVRGLWYGGISQRGVSLNWRLYIPIFYRGAQVSWTTRTITPKKEPRYISASDEESIISVRDLLYGIDHVRDTVIVVEGPPDVWRVGFGAVAIMGLNVSPSQLEQLSRIPNRVICFDNEDKAQDRALKLAHSLGVYEGNTHVARLESGKDCAEASEEEIQELRKYLGPA